ncbi:alkaline phosphatase PhoX [Lewinella sp. JB7]|uniref:alkaline phosphatase PhoX n=1 Tax=Lewinella sp. JB7 TaxID=2962887 RepID=UPI0020C9539D|nr:alkaline phosphatase PhoX [Lewinella sp. JB7]MCP9236613.1 DUF839 domain-containing protein [Lewinella sp. JB7]
MPASHRFQQIHPEGTRYTTGGGVVPTNHDYTAYLPIAGSSERGYLSINHETTPGGVSNLGLHYDSTAHLWVVDSSRAVDFSGDNLVTTMRNCSGGITPWGTVITTEETHITGDINRDGYNDVGWLVEIDPVSARVMEYGNGKPEKLWAVGRVSHENALILSDEVTLFTGEDGGSSALFKFVADQARDLSSGRLYTLRLDAPLDNYEPTSTTGRWIEVPNATPEDRNNTRSLAVALGATNFSGIEDVDVNPLTGQIHFASKGAGRIYQFTDGADGITHFRTFVGGASYDLQTATGPVTEPWGIGNDNLVFDDRGNLWVLQDGGNNYIWVVSADHTQRAPRVKIFGSTPQGAEPTGLTFTPDYRFGFFSIQHPSDNNTPQRDATGERITFDVSSSVVFSRRNLLGAQPPVVDFVADVRTVPRGEPVTFTDRSRNGVQHRTWTFEGGIPETSVDSIVVVHYARAGSYRVRLRASNAEGEETLVRDNYVEVVQSTAVGERGILVGLDVFPNPTDGQLSVRLERADHRELTLDVFDLNGRHLITLERGRQDAADGILTYDLAPLAAVHRVVLLKLTLDGAVAHRLVHLVR